VRETGDEAWRDMGGSPSGAGTRIRTGDLPLTRRLLYQLSYAGMEASRRAQARGHSSDHPIAALMQAGAVQHA
jgi:hypothetical protein